MGIPAAGTRVARISFVLASTAMVLLVSAWSLLSLHRELFRD